MSGAELRKWASGELYKLAGGFASKNPIMGVEYEDYVQELVTAVWARMGDYDESKASPNTFAWNCFRTCRWRLLQRAMTRQKNEDFMQSSFSPECGGSSLSATRGMIDGMNPDCATTQMPMQGDGDLGDWYCAKELFDMLRPIPRMFFEGYTAAQIGKAMGVKASEVERQVGEDVARLRAFAMKGMR